MQPDDPDEPEKPSAKCSQEVRPKLRRKKRSQTFKAIFPIKPKIIFKITRGDQNVESEEDRYVPDGDDTKFYIRFGEVFKHHFLEGISETEISQIFENEGNEKLTI